MGQVKKELEKKPTKFKEEGIQKISREDFEILFWIEFMNDGDPLRLADRLKISKDEAYKNLLDFKNRGWIKIIDRNGKFYGSVLTEDGRKIFEDDKYDNWKEGLW
jgi:DNA-binding MarR family transcriptional regulator